VDIGIPQISDPAAYMEPCGTPDETGLKMGITIL
jgi:hypothetical protein